MLPLEGIRVIALEHAVAAPICTRHLADLGADVIKIERPGEGDFARAYDRFVHGQASFFVWLNRGKRSITLDVKHPDAAKILELLMGSADVVLQNLAPGAAARLGLSHADLAPRHPKLIVCDISGYGESRPIRPEEGLRPAYPGRVRPDQRDRDRGDAVPCWHFGCRHRNRHVCPSGILAALVRRGRSGEGANVKIAMLDALAEWMMYPMYRHAYGKSATPRSPTSHPLLAPYGAHQTMDGQVIFGLQNEREWVTFCAKVLERPDVATDKRFCNNTARREHGTN